ncbi:MAG: hypothetical protein HFF18_14365 [Oscillospiraceae bacterium]|nr:hypothetical protein [Oscillospiraceae bacterium]
MSTNKRLKANVQKQVTAMFALVFLAIYVSTQALAYSTVGAVSVKGVEQEKKYWCWAATAECILDYFGISTTQESFVSLVKGITPAPNVTALDSEVYDGLYDYGLTGTIRAASISFSSTASEIYNERPIYAGISWSSGGGHAVVICGYDSDSKMIEYMEPDDGTFHQMLYSKFKGGSSSSRDWDGTIYGLRLRK